MLGRVIAAVLVAVAVGATASVQERFKPGETFRDCPDCPEMVVIPAGSFEMGSPASEPERYSDEGPRHRVTIPRAFALGKYEVTRGQFAAFVRDTGYRAAGDCYVNVDHDGAWEKSGSHGWRDPTFSQGINHPVVCVNWGDAQAYVRWVSRTTGDEYRLPSEAEWEYAARAGTTTARYWGESPDQACDNANVADLTAKQQSKLIFHIHNCRDGYLNTAPAGNFRANEFGRLALLGNVWEWVEDCWNNGYSGAPSDGRAWTTGKCSRRVLRGGSFNFEPRFVRAAIRFRNSTGYRHFIVGFRVARTLP